MRNKLTESQILDQHGKPIQKPFARVSEGHSARLLHEYDDSKIYSGADTDYTKFSDLIEATRKNKGRLPKGKMLEIEGEILVCESFGEKRFKRVTVKDIAALREARKGEHRLILREASATWPISNAVWTTDTTAFDNEYAPVTGGPWSKQLYLDGLLKMMARCFYERHHNPVAKRCMQITRHFVLGRGVKVKFVEPKAQEAWDAFEKANDLGRMIRLWHDDLRSDGNLYLRFFKPRRRDMPLNMGALDASTIWEIVTDPENLKDVYYYHQQYQSPYQQYVKQGIEAQRYVIRQIPPEEIIHLKINCSAQEKFGRSDFYAVLTYFKMLRDYVAAKAVKAKLQAAFVWDLLVKGMSGDIDSQELNLPDPEHPGSYFQHNEMVELKPLPNQLGTGAGRQDNIFFDILTLIANGIGIPKEFLGTSDTGGTRAAAILASEPGAKYFEDCQQDMEWLYHEIIEKAMAWAKTSGQLGQDVDTSREVIFPEIASEEALKKVQLIGKLEANEVISRETSAYMQAAEARITTYSYADERKKIEKEKAEPEGTFWSHKDNAQVPKWKEASASPQQEALEENPTDKDNPFGSGKAVLKDEMSKEAEMFRGMRMRIRESADE